MVTVSPDFVSSPSLVKGEGYDLELDVARMPVRPGRVSLNLISQEICARANQLEIVKLFATLVLFPGPHL